MKAICRTFTVSLTLMAIAAMVYLLALIASAHVLADDFSDPDFPPSTQEDGAGDCTIPTPPPLIGYVANTVSPHTYELIKDMRGFRKFMDLPILKREGDLDNLTQLVIDNGETILSGIDDLLSSIGYDNENYFILEIPKDKIKSNYFLALAENRVFDYGLSHSAISSYGIAENKTKLILIMTAVKNLKDTI